MTLSECVVFVLSVLLNIIMAITESALQFLGPFSLIDSGKFLGLTSTFVFSDASIYFSSASFPFIDLDDFDLSSMYMVALSVFAL